MQLRTWTQFRSLWSDRYRALYGRYVNISSPCATRVDNATAIRLMRRIFLLIFLLSFPPFYHSLSLSFSLSLTLYFTLYHSARSTTSPHSPKYLQLEAISSSYKAFSQISVKYGSVCHSVGMQKEVFFLYHTNSKADRTNWPGCQPNIY